jgi:hypothetical protein
LRFRIELRDRTFNLRDILDDEALDLNWGYAAVGGCGEFSFRLPRKRFSERQFTGESNIRIYYRNPATDVHDLWYQGLITNKIPSVQGNSENIEISGHGYQSQLSRIRFSTTVTFTAQEASVIVTSLLNTYVTPYTDITYSPSDIEATSFTFDTLEFNLGETVASAIQKIAETVGSIEWGVGKDRDFFFLARSNTIGFRFLQGNNIKSFQDNQDFSDIVNQIYVQGAQSGGTYFTSGPYNDLPSQLKYNLRMEIIQNSSVVTSSVAEQLATARLSDKSEVTRKASANLVDYVGLVESTTPIPLFAEISRKVKFGQKKLGTFLFSGIVGRRINRVNYTLTNNGSLEIALDLGALRPMIAEQISQLEYGLEQQRSAGL